MEDTTQRDLLKKFRDQMTCSLCMGIYTNPRSLPCLHSFCQRCVERLPVTPRGDKDLIICPTCRATAETPKTTGGGGFPVAFHLNNLKEVYVLMKKAFDKENVKCEMCTTANANGYCKDCCQFVCQECDVTHKQKWTVAFIPIRIILAGLDKPWGIAISNDGHVVVAEYYGHCVTVLDKEGRKIKSFPVSKDTLYGDSRPIDVAITPENFILVTDHCKILKINMDGKLIASVGEQGTKPLEFIFPWGITISPTTGQVYVADFGNHRIQVLNPDLTFSFMFGCKGSAEGQFQTPTFITIDNQGIVYVSDSSNHRIQKFTSDGKFLSTFGTEGSDPGQLKNPQGIAIANNLIYVAEEGNPRISVFSTDGKFIHCFGSEGSNIDQFCSPFGMTIDNDEGCLYICDPNRLSVIATYKLYYCQ